MSLTRQKLAHEVKAQADSDQFARLDQDDFAGEAAGLVTPGRAAIALTRA
jgi:hypothetical protein